MADTNETTSAFYGSSVIEVYDGHTDSALYLRDMSGYTYRIGTLPLQDGTYTFTVWLKAMSEMTIGINVLGKLGVFDPVPGEWTRIEIENDSPNKDENGEVIRYIDITPVYSDTSEGIDNDLYLYKAMLELSDKASDWSPAPEDAEADITDLTERLSSAELRLEPDSIVATVLENQTFIDSVSEYQEETRSEVRQVADQLDVVFASQESLASEFESYVNERETWYRFTPESFEIGKTDVEVDEQGNEHQFLMNLTNRELSFRDNGTKVAYINDQVMHITDAEIGHQLTIGNFVFAPTETGMALLYVG